LSSELKNPEEDLNNKTVGSHPAFMVGNLDDQMDNGPISVISFLFRAIFVTPLDV
jgi:hypothetical protein